jgi:hypothetical protein
MQLSEFKAVSAYKKELEQQAKDRNHKEHHRRCAQFFSLMPLMLEKHKNAQIRDNLEVDGTFAVIFKKGEGPDFVEAISLYQDIRDVSEVTTYQKVRNMGFIDLDDNEGFWVLLGD